MPYYYFQVEHSTSNSIMKITKFDFLQDFNIAVQQHNIKTSRKSFSNLFDIKKLCTVVSSLTNVIVGSFHVKSCNPHHQTLMDFVKILTGDVSIKK